MFAGVLQWVSNSKWKEIKGCERIRNKNRIDLSFKQKSDRKIEKRLKGLRNIKFVCARKYVNGLWGFKMHNYFIV